MAIVSPYGEYWSGVKISNCVRSTRYLLRCNHQTALEKRTMIDVQINSQDSHAQAAGQCSKDLQRANAVDLQMLAFTLSHAGTQQTDV